MMKLRYLLPLLFCVLSIFARQALADTACHFTTQQASIPAFWTARTLIGPIGGIDTPLIIMNPQSMEGDFPLFQGAAPITCGGSGSNAVTLTGPTDANLWDQYTTQGSDGPTGLLKTSIPGIVYTYSVRCIGNCHNGNNTNDLDLNLPLPGGTSTFPSHGDAPWTGPSATRNWDIFVTMYQTPDYHPRNGQTDGNALPGKIGTLHIGDAGQNDLDLMMSGASMAFSVMEPTCQGMGINNDEYDRDVDFGDFYRSDFEKTGESVEKPFTFNLFRCSLTTVTVTLTGNHGADNTILTNSSGSAEGVGVKIRSIINNNTQTMKVDGSERVGITYSGNREWYHESIGLDFTGQLIKIGTIKAGTFETVGTFTLSYE
ncbi:TPA: fimbrial protein [Citrobacter koseri]|uniref:Fimbrial protein n=2 Tax=Enterobacteriaceae TaxID=543 RepID=A0AAQ1A6K0_CITKO|nr:MULTISPECIES: fimbrial protein [Citrobacter]ASE81742.1 hypothetical protein CEP66_03145 [Citrobacter koseri]ATF96127.1 hypothetical protein CO700_03260 [Citrobacter koseri]AVE61054.1 hypothetical protein AM352_23395 [Citrobacter koseri]AVE67325.1 hypothetical protein AM351_05620 [Citrobacter koseri]EJK7982935.1 fimbrial protein [Citrobacter koseri]